ncbi:MAG: hypothetical protein ISR64_04745, partial [Deltaproteobacteria bacterium]|nr:hypothetical protein [Deltaproteobacteria bacterium]
TYESKQNVRVRYVDKLERLIHYDEELHRPPRVLFVWGKFMAERIMKRMRRDKERRGLYG